jgi:hypothetical protein
VGSRRCSSIHLYHLCGHILGPRQRIGRQPDRAPEAKRQQTDYRKCRDYGQAQGGLDWRPLIRSRCHPMKAAERDEIGIVRRDIAVHSVPSNSCQLPKGQSISQDPSNIRPSRRDGVLRGLTRSKPGGRKVASRHPQLWSTPFAYSPSTRWSGLPMPSLIASLTPLRYPRPYPITQTATAQAAIKSQVSPLGIVHAISTAATARRTHQFR